jgi:hypothetical protein
VVGLALAAVIATGPLWLRSMGDPGWPSVVPLAAWGLLAALAASRAFDRGAEAALRVLRVGGAGLLVLLALAAPPILARHESGRALFLPARGREVLAWGAWRTAWMAGYFYNDGKVREIPDLGEVERALAAGPVLVLCGPGERRRLEAIPAWTTLQLAEGPRDNALLRVSRR